jgi:predicted kinase
MKTLFLIRGLPGSGKSTLTDIIGGKASGSIHLETDMFFMENGKYNFDSSKLKEAHKWCQDQVENSMIKDIFHIFVSNTFTMEWEMESYYKLAEQYGYRVFSLIVENRHNGVNTHNVPEQTLQNMKNRFEIKL